MWLAQLGKERIDEVADPEVAIDRAFQTYLRKWYSEKWVLFEFWNKIHYSSNIFIREEALKVA